VEVECDINKVEETGKTGPRSCCGGISRWDLSEGAQAEYPRSLLVPLWDTLYCEMAASLVTDRECLEVPQSWVSHSHECDSPYHLSLTCRWEVGVQYYLIQLSQTIWSQYPFILRNYWGLLLTFAVLEISTKELLKNNMYACNPSTQEAETGGSWVLRSSWATQKNKITFTIAGISNHNIKCFQNKNPVSEEVLFGIFVRLMSRFSCLCLHSILRYHTSHKH
jgi:hypothetical protein